MKTFKLKPLVIASMIATLGLGLATANAQGYDAASDQARFVGGNGGAPAYLDSRNSLSININVIENPDSFITTLQAPNSTNVFIDPNRMEIPLATAPQMERDAYVQRMNAAGEAVSKLAVPIQKNIVSINANIRANNYDPAALAAVGKFVGLLSKQLQPRMTYFTAGDPARLGQAAGSIYGSARASLRNSVIGVIHPISSARNPALDGMMGGLPGGRLANLVVKDATSAFLNNNGPAMLGGGLAGANINLSISIKGPVALNQGFMGAARGYLQNTNGSGTFSLLAQPGARVALGDARDSFATAINAGGLASKRAFLVSRTLLGGSVAQTSTVQEEDVPQASSAVAFGGAQVNLHETIQSPGFRMSLNISRMPSRHLDSWQAMSQMGAGRVRLGGQAEDSIRDLQNAPVGAVTQTPEREVVDTDTKKFEAIKSQN